MNSSLLSLWHKKQAALLYFFASEKYLRELQTRIQEIQGFVDGLLDLSRAEGRDRFIRNSHWGERDTSENWSNHAWSFLADFGLSVSRQISDLTSDIYHITGANQCGRGMSEFSMDWTTPAEQEKFDLMFASITNYAGYIDKTMDRTHRAGQWNDFRFFLAWEKHANLFPKLPNFKIRPDIVGKTNEKPPKTGVYISSSFAHSSLQFAWSGDDNGKLRECSIFNNLGQHALDILGRSKLWRDEDAMSAFVRKNADSPELIKDPFYSASPEPQLAPSLVGRNAFTSAPTEWYYVELLIGEFELIEEVEDIPVFNELRKTAGSICDLGGFYFTPAASGSRRKFAQGDKFPAMDSVYGNTIWQWDEKQD